MGAEALRGVARGVAPRAVLPKQRPPAVVRKRVARPYGVACLDTSPSRAMRYSCAEALYVME